jgi:phospholipid-binding lipoprotein MlaA
MRLKNAISQWVAGISICMLLPAVATMVSSGANAEKATQPSKPGIILVPGAKAEAFKKAAKAVRAVEPDQYLHEEFSPGITRIDLASEVNPAGFGDFEGVVLVPPSTQARKNRIITVNGKFAGLVLVEPAAATEPVAESADEIKVPEDLSEEVDDPFEGINRFFFGVNELLDHILIEPTARMYHVIVPEPFRIGIANAVNNIRSPVILANDILQGNRQGASDTIVRFMVNSTIGLGGLIDAAGYMGVQRHSEDFGQTLAVWGVGPGPYMVLPVLGPSNPRDIVGKGVDTAINPLTWILFDQPLEVRMAPSAVELVVGRESILDDYATLRAGSPDLYLSVRDIYSDKRQTEIDNGDVTGDPIPSASMPPSSVTPNVNPF